MFETKELASLLAIVTEGSFDAASRRLSITPGALSQRIRLMEERAGHALLVRSQPARTTHAGSSVLRLAQQFQWLSQETEQQLTKLSEAQARTLTVAVNHDSLATWFLQALTGFATERVAQFDVRAGDQDLTYRMLSDGTAVAAVTTRADAVPGCKVWRLGALRYRAMAEPSFARQWFPHGMDASALATAPMVCFDRTDTLNQRFARRYTKRKLQAMVHYVPASSELALPVRLGLGWSMLPELVAKESLRQRKLLDLAPGAGIDATLYWQVWSLDSTVLSKLTDRVRSYAAQVLS